MNENITNVTGPNVVGTGDNSSAMTWRKKLRDIVPVLKRPSLKSKESKND